MEPETQTTGTQVQPVDPDESEAESQGEADADEVVVERPAVDQRESLRRARPIDHPELGAGLALLDDRRRTLRGLRNGCLYFGIGLLGVAMGIGDTTGGDQMGLLFGIGGLILLFYGVKELVVGGLRLTTPIRLVIAERGFAYTGGPGQVTWPDVAVADFVFEPRETKPSAIGVKIRNPEQFADRHAMTDRARSGLMSHDGWLRIGGGLAMPLDQVLELMQSHVPAAPARVSPANRRRPARTSRH